MTERKNSRARATTVKRAAAAPPEARAIMSVANFTTTHAAPPRARRAAKSDRAAAPLRLRLVLAAIDEVEEVGFERFSVRRIANACGVSCAAPYKHFKNKREIFEAILDYITDVWLERQEQVRARTAGAPLRELLVELALEYVRFMVENPRFRAILMIKDQTFDSDYLEVKAKISDFSKEVILQYCAEHDVDHKTAMIKMYVVRSLIYGASLMFGNRELPYNDVAMRYVRAAIDREFDLPWVFEKDGEELFSNAAGESPLDDPKSEQKSNRQ